MPRDRFEPIRKKGKKQNRGKLRKHLPPFLRKKRRK